MIGHRLEVRETRSDLLFFDGPRHVTTHKRRRSGSVRVRLPESGRAERKQRRSVQAVLELGGARWRSVAQLRTVRRMLRDYSRTALDKALRDASHYGLYDLDRVERMVLKNVERDFFPRFGFGDDSDADGSER